MEEVSGGWRGSYCDSYGVGKGGGFFGGAEESVNGWGGVEMRYGLGFEEVPD